MIIKCRGLSTQNAQPGRESCKRSQDEETRQVEEEVSEKDTTKKLIKNYLDLLREYL